MNHFFAADGRRLAFRDSGGGGRPILCLAGLTRNGRDFDGLAAHYAARYRVIRLDSRGRGGSEHASDPVAEYTVAVETADALALLDHLSIARTAVVGTSRGGILGMAMAQQRPGLVAALALNDIGAAIEMSGLLAIMARLGVAPVGGTLDDIARQTMIRHGADFPDVPLERWVVHAHALYVLDADGHPRLAYDPRLREAADASLDQTLERIDMWPLFDAIASELPMLAVRGEYSDILSKATLAEMAARAPGLETVEVPNRGHAPFLDEPASLDALDRFLGKHWP